MIVAARSKSNAWRRFIGRQWVENRHLPLIFKQCKSLILPGRKKRRNCCYASVWKSASFQCAVELSGQSYCVAMASVELPVISFSSKSAFKLWLEAQPPNSPGAWIKFARKGAVEPTISKSDAIDLALAYGWIDGQLGQVDGFYYKTRFTPRKPKSAWSKINCERVERLIESGQMTQRGLAQVEAAKADGRWELAYAPQSTAVPHDDLQTALDADPGVCQTFKELDSANRYAIIYRVHQARTAEKRAAKIAELLDMLRRGETIHPRRRRPKPH